jgi:hypothetical protein
MKFACVALAGAMLAEEIFAARGGSKGANPRPTFSEAQCVDSTGDGEGNFMGAAKLKQRTDMEGEIKIWSFWNDFIAEDNIIICIYDEADCNAGEGTPIEIDAMEMLDTETGITAVHAEVDNGDMLSDYIDVRSIGLIIEGTGRVNCCNIVDITDDWDAMFDSESEMSEESVESVSSVSEGEELAPVGLRGEVAPPGDELGDEESMSEDSMSEDSVDSMSEDSVDSMSEDSMSAEEAADEGAGRLLVDQN